MIEVEVVPLFDERLFDRSNVILVLLSHFRGSRLCFSHLYFCNFNGITREEDIMYSLLLPSGKFSFERFSGAPAR